MTSRRGKIVFLHLHKTGGLSANAVLVRQYLGRPGFVVHRNVQEGIARLVAMPQTDRDRLEYVSGHVFWGIHEIWDAPASYFTFLREPIARTISNYAFIGVTARGKANPELRGEFDTYMSNPERGVYMTERLAGYVPGQPGHIPETSHLGAANLLTLAESHLRAMSVVGLTENFDKSLMLLRRAYGWRNLYYVRRNTTADKSGANQYKLAPEQAKSLREVYAPDLALYEVAKSLFSEQCRTYGDALDADVSIFQKNNALFGRLSDATERIRSLTLYRAVRRLTAGLFRS